VRGAPRDALVADITPLELRGASFGLRQSLDTVGAFLGPLAAIVLMLALRGNIRGVFCIAVAPAFISVALLAFLVHEPTRAAAPHSVRQAPRWSELRRFPARFWRVVAIGAVFTLARFSEAFLVLRASGLGLSAAYIPLVLVVMNVVYAATSYPAGHLSDRADRRRVLALGGAALIASDLTLAAAHGLPALMAGVALWGLHMGFSQGLLSAMVADAAPAERRATGFGLFSLVSGLVLLLASVIAGVLWDRLGAPATFLAGAVFAALAVAGLLVHMRNHPQPVTG
jgi:MFS family permease